jgi:sulfate transport system ATP-binding protein
VNVFRDPRNDQVVYARPHEIEIGALPGDGTVEARVEEARAAGAIVRFVALAAKGTPIHIEVTREEYQRLDISKGQTVYLRPRNARAFRDEVSRVER